MPMQYSLGKVLPGQRDGSLLWYKDLAKFVKECSLQMTEYDAYPSILRSKNGDCCLMVHVDDLLIVGTRTAVMHELVPALREKYSISIEVMSRPGDQVTFLKRTHELLDDGRMTIHVHHKHLDQLCKLLCLSKFEASVEENTRAQRDRDSGSNQRAETCRCFDLQDMHWNLVVSLSGSSTVSVCDSLPLHFLLQANREINDCAETPCWVHGSALRTVRITAMERDACWSL